MCPEFLSWAMCATAPSSAWLQVLEKAPSSCNSCINIWRRSNERSAGSSTVGSAGRGIKESGAVRGPAAGGPGMVCRAIGRAPFRSWWSHRQGRRSRGHHAGDAGGRIPGPARERPAGRPSLYRQCRGCNRGPAFFQNENGWCDRACCTSYSCPGVSLGQVSGIVPAHARAFPAARGIIDGPRSKRNAGRTAKGKTGRTRKIIGRSRARAQ